MTAKELDKVMIKHLQPLMGRTIQRVVVDHTDKGIGPVYGLEMDGGTLIAWIFCDPEGNGPGHLHIEGDV